MMRSTLARVLIRPTLWLLRPTLRVLRLVRLVRLGRFLERACTIRFKSNYSDWRHLSNLYAREFDVPLRVADGLVDRNSGNLYTFPSVEALYQGLKMSHTAEFRQGGELEGDRGVQLMETSGGQPSFGKTTSKSVGRGFTGMVAMRLLKALRPNPHGLSGAHKLITESVAHLRGLTMRARLSENDSGLMLLACQLLMYSQNEDARRLLEATGDRRLEEHAEDVDDFWCLTADGTRGQNCNGQNVMLVRRLLRAGGYCELRALSMRIFAELCPTLAEASSPAGLPRRSRWNEPGGTSRTDGGGERYSAVLSRLEAELLPGHLGRRGWGTGWWDFEGESIAVEYVGAAAD